jgi:hypothetical protein
VTERVNVLKQQAEDRDDADMMEEIMDNDEKALGHIKCNISPSYLEIVLPATAALEAWSALDVFFAGKETFNKIHLLEQLIDGKMQETNDPANDVQKFLQEKTELVRRLAACGLTLDEEVVVAIMLARLPESYETMRRIVETQQNLTIVKISAELNREAVRRKRKREDQAHYGQEEHKQPDPKKPKIDKSKLDCSYCKGKGHIASKCWLNPQSTSYRRDLVEKLTKRCGGNDGAAPRE